MIFEQLGEHIEITSGQIMTRITTKESEDPPIESRKVIVPKAITQDGYIDADELPVEDLKMLPDSKRLTEIDDIVIKLSTPFDSALITEETVGCLVPSFCAIIRSKGTLDLNYIRAFLASNYCKEQLRAKVTGAVMSILSIGKIQTINIPVPDMSEQIRIGLDYKNSQEKIQVMNKIIKLENKRNDIAFQEFLI